jgi:polyhydroxybutyrate depolymerase
MPRNQQKFSINFYSDRCEATAVQRLHTNFIKTSVTIFLAIPTLAIALSTACTSQSPTTSQGKELEQPRTMLKEQLRSIGATPPTAITATNTADIQETLIYQNIKRTYLVHLPTGYQKGKRYPLVLAFHGGGGQPEDMRSLTGFNAVGDRENFIVVYPAGNDQNWADGRPEIPPAADGIDDVGFISKLIDKLVLTYGIDRKRVYAAGISNGAMFSQRLACDLSNKITAIGSVAGGLSADIAPTCQPTRAIPMSLIVGTDDPIYSFENGFNRFGRILPPAATITQWVNLNQCAAEPQVALLPNRAPLDGTRIERRIYPNCRAGSAVNYFIVQNGGHTWPGGPQYLPPRRIGKTSRDMDASNVLWQFFQQFQLP